MTDQSLAIACLNAIFYDKVKAPKQWDLEGAIKMRAALFSLPDCKIPNTATAIDIYNAVLPLYDFKTTDDDDFMPAFQSPTMEELQKALSEEQRDKGDASPVKKVFLSKVEGYYDSQGLFTPTAILWTDKLRYEVTFKERRLGHSEKVGGIGTRYIVMVHTKNISHSRTIFQDETNRWFIESKK